MRQGYYIANGKTLPAWLKSPRAKTGKPAFTMDEYDFWYNGKPAATDLPGITGHVGDVKKGQVRDGGSFLQRSKHYSTWNSYFKRERLPGQAVQRLPQRIAPVYGGAGNEGSYNCGGGGSCRPLRHETRQDSTSSG